MTLAPFKSYFSVLLFNFSLKFAREHKKKLYYKKTQYIKMKAVQKINSFSKFIWNKTPEHDFCNQNLNMSFPVNNKAQQ